MSVSASIATDGHAALIASVGIASIGLQDPPDATLIPPIVCTSTVTIAVADGAQVIGIDEGFRTIALDDGAIVVFVECD